MGKENEFRLEHVDMKVTEKYLCVYVCACLFGRLDSGVWNLEKSSELEIVMGVISMQLLMEPWVCMNSYKTKT